jgi:hypothetical protein
LKNTKKFNLKQKKITHVKIFLIKVPELVGNHLRNQLLQINSIGIQYKNGATTVEIFFGQRQ